MVEISIDLLSLTIFSQKVSKHSLTPHPENFLRETGIARAQPLTVAAVSALAFRNQVVSHAGSGMDSYRLLDDKAIGHELTNVLPYSRSGWRFAIKGKISCTLG